MPAKEKVAPDLDELIREKNIRALIFDLDGVITQTARLHARAWEKMFDEFLQNGTENAPKSQPPFSIETDYPRYLDGMSRIEGIRNFLRSRNVELPAGNPEDSFESGTVWGLGNQKNRYYQEIMRQNGVDVYADTIAWIRQKRSEGFPIALISASKNCREVLQITKLEELFDVKIDGITAAERNLKSKPAPDVFLEAAKALNVAPAQAAVFEDARAGVKAGKTANFGLVVGINRRDGNHEKELLASGADLVITGFPVINEH